MRLSEETLKKLDEIADGEKKDRSMIIREFLDQGIKEKRIQNSIDKYKSGKVTAWRAAELAGLSLYEFIDILRDRKIPAQYSMEDLERDLKPIEE